MDVRDFLVWSKRATASLRAEAAAAAAKAYLYSDMEDDVREGLDTALTVLLDDPTPMVRSAMADALTNSPKAPRHIILALAGDQTEISTTVLSRSPVLVDGELIDFVATMDDQIQLAIASRPVVSAGVSAALTELGTEYACLTLLDNPGAVVAAVSLGRLADRFGDDAVIRTALLDRRDLPIEVRHLLIGKVSQALNNLVQLNYWLGPERAELVTREACDQATVAIAHEGPADELIALAEHLRLTKQLTTSLLLRALCAGNLAFFSAAMSVLSRISMPRLQAMFHDRHLAAFRAAYRRAGLPERAFGVFATAIRTSRQYSGESVDPDRRNRFTKLVLDEVLARYEESGGDEMNELMAMLRRFAGDAHRAAAREFLQIEVEAA